MVPENRKFDVAIVGAGISGIAHALAAARLGLSVVIFERDEQAQGTSARSFGMIMPLSVTPGEQLKRANRTRAIWLELAREVGFWHETPGALILAYHSDELAVLAEFNHSARERGYDVELLSRQQVLDHAPNVNKIGLLGALYSRSEMFVDPREAVRKLPDYLAEKYGVSVQWSTPVSAVAAPHIEAGGQTWEADRIIVCTGSDFNTLYPEAFDGEGLTRCKLQMMRTAPQPNEWRMGPMVAGGLTLAQYPSFKGCKSLGVLTDRLDRDYPRFRRWGIHVMAVQNGRGEITIGDSHQYGDHVDEKRSEEVDGLILRMLNSMINVPDTTIQDRWENVYAKSFDRDLVRLKPEPAVDIVTGFGGTDLTTGFAVAEEAFAKTSVSV